MLTVLAICIGASLGALARWGLGLWLNPVALLPLGTLAANLLGGYLVGICVAVFSARPGRIKTELAVDFPHPRHYTIKTSPEFMALKARLTEEIRAEAMATDVH